MKARRLPVDEGAIRRFLGGLWLPYDRELETTLGGGAIVDGDRLLVEDFREAGG